jgi:PIN domain nuclease of toxin-antitoxin system
LPLHHRDPFDRLLVSADSAIRAYGNPLQDAGR